jgi:hypothetical protein
MSEPLDAAIASIARRQHGNITRRQLLALGLDDNAIDYRRRAGRLIRLHHGVYAVGHAPTTALGRAAAAVLACGREAEISHDSGISLWGWRSDWRMPFEVTAPSCHRHRGIWVHRATGLTRADIRIQLGIRVTSPARTILDVAPRLKTRRAVTRLVNDARETAHLQLSSLADVLTRFPRHPGAKLLTPFIAAPAGPTRSEFEIAFVEFAETHGLPRPEMNVMIGGHLVDAWFATERLVVELDSYGIHWTQQSFESDRDRDADLLDRLAIPTVRVTWERMTGKPVAEAARLHRILAARRP